MTDPRFKGRNSYPSGHHSRWPDPWRSEDHWGPIAAAVVSLTWLDSLSTAAPTSEQFPFLTTLLRAGGSRRLRCPQHTCFHLHQTYKYRSFPYPLAADGSAGPSGAQTRCGGFMANRVGLFRLLPRAATTPSNPRHRLVVGRLDELTSGQERLRRKRRNLMFRPSTVAG
jgi:hypothetical protein